MNMPARRHRTSPHKGTSCGAKGGMLADGPRILYEMKVSLISYIIPVVS